MTIYFSIVPFILSTHWNNTNFGFGQGQKKITHQHWQTPYPSVHDFCNIKLEKSSSTNWMIFSLFHTGFLLPEQPAKINFEIDFYPVCWTWFFQLDFLKIKYRWIGQRCQFSIFLPSQILSIYRDVINNPISLKHFTCYEYLSSVSSILEFHFIIVPVLYTVSQ